MRVFTLSGVCALAVSVHKAPIAAIRICCRTEYMRMLPTCRYDVPCPGLLVGQLEIARSPALVEPAFHRPVESEDHVVAFPGPRLHPVAFLPGGRFRTEPNRRRTVGVLFHA